MQGTTIQFYRFLCLLFILFIFTERLSATEEYARESGKKCIACHEKSEGGGKLNLEGQLYLNRILREQAAQPPKSIFQPGLNLGIGFLHILAGIFWLGSMIYMFLLAKTPYAAKGPLKNEIKAVLITIILTGLTGMFLLYQRYQSLEELGKDWLGELLRTKIMLYLLMMVVTAILYGIIIPGLRKRAAPASDRSVGKAISVKDLRLFDGRYNRPAYVGYKGKIFDVTESRYWSNGEHFFRHYTGQDLTPYLQDAPHGAENILRRPLAGEIMDQQKIYAHWRITLAFYAAVTFNLICGLGIVVLIALRHWWE